MPYTDVFGGANIYPSEISYSAITLTGDIALSWPQETSASNNLATRIIDVTASPNKSIFLPGATKAATGETILFNNLGSNAFTVKDAVGLQVLTLAAGTVWQVYLTDNATEAGTWVALQYGAAISSANASSLAGTGIVAIGTLLSQSMPVVSFNVNYASGTNDRAKTYVWTGSGSGVLNLPDPAVVGNNWFFYVKNSGGGQLTVTPTGSTLVDGLSTKIYQNNESSILVSDGVNFYSVGFGKSTTFTFDFTTINVSGTGNYTLTGSQLNRIVYKFTGALTGNRNIVVPETVQQYWVDNSTTGSFSLSVTTLAGTPQAVGQGQRAIIYCDGSNVVDADTSAVAVPLSVTEGGTGAVTPSAARINLGGTSVGVALFTAANIAAAWAALGNQPFLSGGEF